MKQLLDFKSNDAKCAKLQQLLQEPVLQEALALVELTFRPGKPKVSGGNDAALTLALTHAYAAGAFDAFEILRALSIRGTGPVKPPKEWGDLIELDLNGKPRKRS